MALWRKCTFQRRKIFVIAGICILCGTAFMTQYVQDIDSKTAPRRMGPLGPLSPPSKTSKLQKVILYWIPFNGNLWIESEKTLVTEQCPDSCAVITDKNDIENADAVNFHLVDLWPDNWNIGTSETIPFPSYRRSDQVWILTNQEPPTHMFGNLRVFNGLFNWTAWYRSDSVVQLPYGLPVALTEQESTRMQQTTSKRNFFKEKTKEITGRISNCKDQGKRYRLIRELQTYLDIDMYGGCYNNSCYGENCSHDLHKYKFYLSFENARCKDYVTEKYWEALRRNQIPIVNWNYSNINRTLVIPGSFISIYDFPSIRDFASYIQKVGSNETLYNSYFEWKNHYKDQTRCSSCEICSRLHSNTSIHVIKDLDKWVRNDICPKVEVFNNLLDKIDRRLFEWGW
ncbi:alpha-(1,3)-fucosyltransferase fut-5-like [Dreissena polymorpha]|nr:alpha-(1,3)-fucosyltransferase fut-5-like [Dreissena polymorpha]